MSDNKKKIAVVPGSFDPITYGHINIAVRAAEMYDEVYLAVMINSEKKYMFSLSEREHIAKISLAAYDKIKVISSDGYLWKLAEDIGACAIVKGVRNDTDREYELKMAEYNAKYNPNAKTVLLKTDESLSHISSTLVREKINGKESISEYLPKEAVEEIYKILDGRACQNKK